MVRIGQGLVRQGLGTLALVLRRAQLRGRRSRQVFHRLGRRQAVTGGRGRRRNRGRRVVVVSVRLLDLLAQVLVIVGLLLDLRPGGGQASLGTGQFGIRAGFIGPLAG